MSKDLKESINPLVKSVNTQWNQIINILQDLKVEIESQKKKTQTEIKLEMKYLGT